MHRQNRRTYEWRWCSDRNCGVGLSRWPVVFCMGSGLLWWRFAWAVVFCGGLLRWSSLQDHRKKTIGNGQLQRGHGIRRDVSIRAAACARVTFSTRLLASLARGTRSTPAFYAHLPNGPCAPACACSAAYVGVVRERRSCRVLVTDAPRFISIHPGLIVF